MTPIEAISYINNAVLKVARSNCKAKYSKALQMAIKALEKQTPQKPNFEGDGYDENGYLIYDTWICPCCEEAYEVDYDDYKHCPNCGQAIDWSDSE